jgi:hypothetical protein
MAFCGGLFVIDRYRSLLGAGRCVRAAGVAGDVRGADYVKIDVPGKGPAR